MFESASAMDACWRIEWFDLDFGFSDFKTERQLDKGFDLFQRNGSPRTQEAEIANFHETGWQYMLKEAPHKFHDIQAHGAPTVALKLSIFEKDPVILNFNDAAV